MLAPEKMRPQLGFLSKNVEFFSDHCLLDIPPGPQSQVKTFSFGSAEPREEVASAPRSAVRRSLLRLVDGIYARQGLPTLQLPFYPKGYRSVFSFRVDADEYEEVSFDRFFETAKTHSHAISIFFSMANYEKHADQIRRCLDAGFDVHSHAYTHYNYRSYAQNLFNLRKADEALRRIGVPKKGFASPYGRWNKNLQRAVDEMGYDFSSEFSYNYDDFPSYPVICGKRSSVLQVPVHPVGLGVYMESASQYNESEVKTYFGRLFRQKYERGEPILFYDHPTKWLGYHPEMLDYLFDLASERSDLWVCSMSEWAGWWKKRLSTAAPLDPLIWKRPPADNGEEGKVYRERRVSRRVKDAIKKWLDWETSTPCEEIIRDSVPSRIKFILRQFR